MQKLSAWTRMKLALKLATGTLKETDPNAGGLMAGLVKGNASQLPARNTVQLLEAFNESPWVRACAGKVADMMASVRWRVFVVRGKQTGKLKGSRDISYLQRAADPELRRKLISQAATGDDVEEVRSHLFLDVLHKPNSEMTGIEMRFLDSIWLDMVGDSFFLKERNGVGAPIALWPLPPNWIAETPLRGRPTFRISWGGWQSFVPQSEILWHRNPNPVMPYGRGSGLGRSLDDEIANSEYASKHTLSFFRNQGRPDLIVMPKDGNLLGDAERDRLEQWWTDKLQGFWRRFKPLFMKTPMEIKVLEQNFRDMQMLELKQQESDTIMQVWGIPPEVFGRVTNSNRATSDVAKDTMARYVLVPRLERMRESLQEFLVSDYDPRLILDYVSPIPADKDYSLSVFKAQPGAFELNEFREMAGMPKKDELEGEYGSASPVGAGQPAEGVQQLDWVPDSDLKEIHNIMVRASRKERVRR